MELQKAQRVARQEEGWEKAREKLQRVVDLTLKYCEGQTLDHNDCSLLTRNITLFPACRQVCGAGGRGQLQRLSSARLALQGVISKTKVYRHTPIILPLCCRTCMSCPVDVFYRPLIQMRCLVICWKEWTERCNG